MSELPSVLVIDDNEVDRERVRRLLRGAARVREAETGRAGLEACADGEAPDCVLLDHRLPDADGADLIDRLLELGVAIVMLSGQGSEQLAVTAIKRGAHDYLAKDGLTEATLRTAIRHALHARDLRREVSLRQAEVARSEHRLRLLVDQLPCVAWTTDGAGGIASVVGSGLRGLAGAEEGGSRLAELLAAPHRAVLGSGRAERVELEADGRRLQAELRPLRGADGAVEGVIGVALDVTEQHSLEAQLRQSQKMEALGQLAGGIAHDFNNLLTGIVGFTRLAQAGLPPGAPAHDDLDEVLRATSRASDLTRQLLAVARRRPQARARSVEPALALRGMVKMFQHLLGADISLQTHIREPLPLAAVDPSGFEQIVLNLVVNARDAMRARGGALHIALDDVLVEHPLEDPRGEAAAPGAYVRLVVADSGTGMPPEVRERLFEPFFTTKPVGEGTGLGLATIYGIVRQAGGVVHVYSEVGHGTTFRIFLPAWQGEAPTSAPTAAPPDGRSTAGTESILVVEDDPLIRALVERTLAGAGYQPTACADGESALACLEGMGRPPDLVLADVVTPGMDVASFVQGLLARTPARPVALMTGWSPHTLSRDPALSALPVLEKPFGPAGLLAFVRRVLDEAARSAPAGL